MVTTKEQNIKITTHCGERRGIVLFYYVTRRQRSKRRKRRTCEHKTARRKFHIYYLEWVEEQEWTGRSEERGSPWMGDPRDSCASISYENSSSFNVTRLHRITGSRTGVAFPQTKQKPSSDTQNLSRIMPNTMTQTTSVLNKDAYLFRKFKLLF